MICAARRRQAVALTCHCAKAIGRAAWGPVAGTPKIEAKLPGVGPHRVSTPSRAGVEVSPRESPRPSSSTRAARCRGARRRSRAGRRTPESAVGKADGTLDVEGGAWEADRALRVTAPHARTGAHCGAPPVAGDAGLRGPRPARRTVSPRPEHDGRRYTHKRTGAVHFVADRASKLEKVRRRHCVAWTTNGAASVRSRWDAGLAVDVRARRRRRAGRRTTKSVAIPTSSRRRWRVESGAGRRKRPSARGTRRRLRTRGRASTDLHNQKRSAHGQSRIAERAHRDEPGRR
ncbi:hypothetical protein PsYK624_089710 [Phanerochaete sordida]|uniref:Uncharacterized protein n=1 Tax=Phanerochaete sordida TaxID=48140 RepID=A0A9P3LFN2_9APHY|nr:hypothetical protein PsYK624_089710 [Phanerochaete sordida]